MVVENEVIIDKFSKQYEGPITNNQMELEAVLFVMKNYACKEEDCWISETPTVYCDSSYVVNTFNDWMFRWANNDWKNSSDKTPENLNIIKEYFNLYQQGYRINLRKIAGHSGNPFNDLADRLATNQEKGDIVL